MPEDITPQSFYLRNHMSVLWYGVLYVQAVIQRWNLRSLLYCEYMCILKHCRTAPLYDGLDGVRESLFWCSRFSCRPAADPLQSIRQRNQGGRFPAAIYRLCWVCASCSSLPTG